jgi:hypothetical protein
MSLVLSEFWQSRCSAVLPASSVRSSSPAHCAIFSAKSAGVSALLLASSISDILAIT